MRRIALTLSLGGLIGACTSKENAMPPLPDLSAVRAKLAFTCTHEADRLPALDPQADSLFHYANYLEKRTPKPDYNDIARYYRIAAAYGHYKANSNLQKLVSEGYADSPNPAKETIALAAQLIDQGVPGGYYDIGYYLDDGYGLKQDSEMALRYFRKGADLGSPEAQNYVADKLSPIDIAPVIGRQMYQCAVDQGFGAAATTLGIDLKNKKLYPEAVKTFQKGVAEGNPMSASFLESGFNGPLVTNQLDYLALAYDPERVRRYELIWKFLTSRTDLGFKPKLPDIEQIVPLPPAPLPPWDGTFQWQKEHDAAVPPPKPADELIQRLSKQKNLDPATGLPVPPPPRLPLGSTAQTGQRCPQGGVWRTHPGAMVSARFRKGDILPPAHVEVSALRDWWDYVTGRPPLTVAVTWRLAIYKDQV